jgi:type IV fimbrial biogenesis protein FimT
MNDYLSNSMTDKINGNSHIPFICRNVPIRNYKSAHPYRFIRSYLPSIGNKLNIGFTLIELMVTLAILAITVALAAPNMRGFIQNQRITTLTNDLMADLSTARTEAIRRATPVVVCSSSSGNACDGGGNWANGRFIFADVNSNGSYDPVNGDEVVRSRERLPNNTLTTIGVPDPLIYSARGTTNFVAAISFTLCDDRGAANGKIVQISGTGQPRVVQNPPAGC